MRYRILCAATLVCALSATANATTFTFTTDPFAGSDALITPGRQIVGDEPFIDFSIDTDVFALSRTAFDLDRILFVNDVIGNIPTGGVNVVVLETFDDDADPDTPFGAGSAASLIAAQITVPGPGFFIYFNSGLDLPRLVFSTDLSNEEADLKVIARMVNLAGQSNLLPGFTEANFTLVPEPSGLLLLFEGGLLWLGAYGIRRRRTER